MKVKNRRPHPVAVGDRHVGVGEVVDCTASEGRDAVESGDAVDVTPKPTPKPAPKQAAEPVDAPVDDPTTEQEA